VDALDPRAEAVARQVRLVEEVLVEDIEDGALRLDPHSRVSGRRIVFHGHCHQKALAGTAATVALLERIPGAEVAELDAGCCGMAGSFGYEAEHYEVSRKIGEERLFPTVRQQSSDTVIAVAGVSCREQIGHFTQRRPVHIAEVLAERIDLRATAERASEEIEAIAAD
jgi:Fe-S oxidoreductase